MTEEFPELLEVTLTHKQAGQSVRRNASCCLLATAVKEQLQCREVSVLPYFVILAYSKEGAGWAEYFTTEKSDKIAWDFDNGIWPEDGTTIILKRKEVHGVAETK